MANHRPVLVAGAPLLWTRRLADLAAAAEPLLAADSGADHLARLGLRPVAVIGDLDSISQQTRAWLGEETLVRRPDQDRTDLDKALEYAFEEMGLQQVTVVAALGGRSDHETGSLGLLAGLGIGERLHLEGENHRVLAVRGAAVLQASPGETWSFWTYDPSTRVSIEGVRWPIDGAPLDAGRRPSISNRAVSTEVRIKADGGSVIVARYFEETPAES
ncbi:MAG: thiamine diphosphokinase [Thermoanaerobaculales bacterium]